MSPYMGKSGLRQLAKLGIMNSDDVVSTDTVTTIASMGDLVVDRTTGQLSYVDADTKTQTLS